MKNEIVILDRQMMAEISFRDGTNRSFAYNSMSRVAEFINFENYDKNYYLDIQINDISTIDRYLIKDRVTILFIDSPESDKQPMMDSALIAQRVGEKYIVIKNSFTGELFADIPVSEQAIIDYADDMREIN